MKLKYYYIIIFSLMTFLCAADNRFKDLKREIADYGTGKKLDILIEEAEKNFKKDPVYSVQISQEAYKLSYGTEYREKYAKCCRIYAFSLLRALKKEGLDFALKAEKYYKEINDFRNLAEINYEKSVYYKNIFDKKNAVKYLDLADSLNKVNDENKALSGKIIYVKANILKLDHPEEAERLFLKSLEIFSEQKDTLIIAKINNALGSVYVQMNKIKLAEEYLNRSFNFFQETDNMSMMITPLTNFGLIAVSKHEYDKAINYFEQALILSEEGQYTKFIPDILTQLIFINSEMGREEDNIRLYKQKVSLYEERNDIGAVLSVKIKLMILGMTLNDLKLSRESMAEITELTEKHPDKKQFKKIAEVIYNANAMEFDDLTLEVFELLKYGDRKINLSFMPNYLSIFLNLDEYDSANYIYKMFEDESDFFDPGKTYLSKILIGKKEWSKALEILNKQLKIYGETENKTQLEAVLLDIGEIYFAKENWKEAKKYFFRALELEKDYKHDHKMYHIYNFLGKIDLKEKNYGEAKKNLRKSLRYAEKYGFKAAAYEARSNLAKVYAESGDYEKAYIYLDELRELTERRYSSEMANQFSKFSSQLQNLALAGENRCLNHENQIKVLELSKEKLQKRVFVYLFVFAFLLGGASFFFYMDKMKTNFKLKKEHKKVNELLLNMLPASVAEKLKENNEAPAPEVYDNVSICFADIVNFTEISAHIKPKDMIYDLNIIFTGFDKIIKKYGGFRIKTSGDLYMGACGFPLKDEEHASKIILASMEFLEYIKNKRNNLFYPWDVRIGIDSGSLVGGIVGVSKYLFDVFGDTVNTASRMEENSETGKINISERTYELVKEKFVFEEREELQVKGKGMMKMYFVKGKKTSDL